MKAFYAGYLRLRTLPLQQWLHERPSLLPYTYIACLVELCSDDPSDVTVQWVALMLRIRWVPPSNHGLRDRNPHRGLSVFHHRCKGIT
jgi:hypothetical protein